MKIKDLIKDDIQMSGWWVNDYITSNLDYEKDEFEQVINLNEVLRNVYIATTFLDDVNNGGIDYYYDCSAGKFRNYLYDVFEKIGSKEVCKIVKDGNEIIKKIENRIGDEITDNIQETTDLESKKLSALTKKMNNLNSNDELYELISNYVNQNLDVEI